MTKWQWVSVKRKSMVVQGIKDRSEIREHKVTRRQGYGDEGETRKGKLGEDPEMGVHGRKGRSRGDPGKIHRSVGVWCSGVLEEKGRREGGRGQRDEGERESYGCLMGSNKGDWGVRGKENVTQEVNHPLPHRSCVNLISALLLLVWHSDIVLHKL